MTNIPSWKLRLESMEDALTPSEVNLADCISKDPYCVLGKSIKQIAAYAYVSPATVTRFLHHLGYSGLKEFKYVISNERTKEDLPSELKISVGKTQKRDTRSLKETAFTNYIEALQDTMQILDDKELEKAIDHLSKASYVETIAVGGSAAIARTAIHNFRKCGMRVSMTNDINTNYLDTEKFSSEDIAFIISLSGETKEILELARKVKDKKVYLICLTGNRESSLAKISDCVLVSYSRRRKEENCEIFERGAQIATIYALYMGICEKHKGKI